MIVDSHAHLEMERFDEDREEVIKRARDAGVEIILSVGNAEPEKGSMEKAVELCEKYDFIYTSVGIHPHDAKIFNDKYIHKIMDLCENEKVIAIGEIGLDYYYDLSPRSVQRGVFRDLLILAKEKKLPVIIHSRDANRETEEILEKYYSDNVAGGILHCFSGDLELAKSGIKMGLYISFSGVITFKKSYDLRDIASKIKRDYILVETDAPYLAPVPHRGKRNEPSYVIHVAEKLAEVRQESFEEVCSYTTKNFKKLFKL